MEEFEITGDELVEFVHLVTTGGLRKSGYIDPEPKDLRARALELADTIRDRGAIKHKT